jgi:hypothetical protein
MRLKQRTFAAFAALAMFGIAVIANAGASEASTADVYRFRLSNFGWVVANICVHTDSATVCSGKWARGKSEIFDVPANALDNWYCTADIEGGPGIGAVRFSRVNTKECVVDGTILNYNLSTK